MGRSAEKDLRRANTGSGELQDDDAVCLLCAQDAACWACIACLGVLFLNGRAKRLTSTVVPYVGGMFFAEISQLSTILRVVSRSKPSLTVVYIALLLNVRTKYCTRVEAAGACDG